MDTTLDTAIARVLPEIIELRHAFHEHPEIRYEENWTSGRIAAFLDEAGVPYERGLAKGTGIVATLGGDGPATVALRADMDALEIQEQTGLPYASRIPNRMHACGHDGHLACLCGALKVLAGHPGRLRGTVKFLFQPAEELEAGARHMVAEGVMDGVDAVFGLHGWPTVPLGRIALKPGWMMASADMFEIDVIGKGCHGADPASGIDPIVVAAHIVTALQTIAAREVNPVEPALVSVGAIEAGDASNIIPEVARMRGTLRAFDPDVFDAIRASVLRIAEGTAGALRATAAVRFGDEAYPALFNDPAMTAFVAETARDMLGEEGVAHLEKPIMVSEDFAYFLQKAPGAFFLLGVNPNPDQPYPALHSPYYDFGDGAVAVGVKLMASLVLRFLERA
ncbi:MAG: amidohydrolase [Candidatus Hydrogenedentes bacterium]|nr:amidohydrolase [Candidatus Hydrogenedentota bacterium]